MTGSHWVLLLLDVFVVFLIVRPLARCREEISRLQVILNGEGE